MPQFACKGYQRAGRLVLVWSPYGWCWCGHLMWCGAAQVRFPHAFACLCDPTFGFQTLTCMCTLRLPTSSAYKSGPTAASVQVVAVLHSNRAYVPCAWARAEAACLCCSPAWHRQRAIKRVDCMRPWRRRGLRRHAARTHVRPLEPPSGACRPGLACASLHLSPCRPCINADD